MASIDSIQDPTLKGAVQPIEVYVQELQVTLINITKTPYEQCKQQNKLNNQHGVILHPVRQK